MRLYSAATIKLKQEEGNWFCPLEVKEQLVLVVWLLLTTSTHFTSQV